MFIAEAVVRGTSFRPIEAKAFVNAVEEGETLILQREPSNPHDENAIKVLSPDPDNIHLGYIAREVAEELAPMMDAGRKLVPKVSGRMSASVITVDIHEDDSDDTSLDVAA